MTLNLAELQSPPIFVVTGGKILQRLPKLAKREEGGLFRNQNLLQQITKLSYTHRHMHTHSQAHTEVYKSPDSGTDIHMLLNQEKLC